MDYDGRHPGVVREGLYARDPHPGDACPRFGTDTELIQL